jgi:hypothetical protein
LAVTESLGCYFVAHRGTEIIQLNGSSWFKSFFDYNLLEGRTAYLLIGIENSTNFSSPVLEIKLGSTCNELYLSNNSFYLGQSSTSINKEELTRYSASFNQSIETNGKNISASWNLVGISFINSTTGSLTLNGMKISMAFNNTNSLNSTTLTVGQPQVDNSSSSLGMSSFYATDPYLFGQNSSLFSQGLFYHYNKTIELFPINCSNSQLQQIPFAINVAGKVSSLILGELAVKTLQHISYVAFGQINTSSFTFNMKVSLVKIQKESQTLNYSLIIFIDAFVMPLSVFLIWAIDSYIYKRS